MGGVAIKDQLSSKSPWNTQIVIDNQCSTPVRVYLARNPEDPTVENAVDHSVPAQASYAIHSGWVQESLATLIIRVGVHEAKIYRMAHMTQLKLELAPSGLKVTSTDPMTIEDFPDPGSVPNNDTAPMVLRGESFLNRKPDPKEPIGSITRQVSSGLLPRSISDQIASKSPWNTQIVIDNQCTTPLRVYLARNPEEPTVKDAIEHSVPPQASYTIQSGWLQEPSATLIMRTGVHEAKIYRMPHMAQLRVELAPTGLKVTSTDSLIIKDYPDPGSVPNNDTIPMVLREESFLDRRPGSKEPRSKQPPIIVARQAVSNWPSSPPSAAVASAPPPQFSAGLEPTVHGKAMHGGLDLEVR